MGRYGTFGRAMLIAAGLALGTASDAQTTEAIQGTNIRTWHAARIPETGIPPAERGRATLHEFARCMIERHRAASERVLTKPAFGPGREAYSAFVDGDCLHAGQISFAAEALRGALYIGLYQVDFAGKAPPLGKAAVAFDGDVGADASDTAKRYVQLRQFGDCVVRIDTEDSRALVLSDVASSEEATAIARLAPHLGDCLAPGLRVSFDKMSLSGLIGEALYRETRAAS